MGEIPKELEKFKGPTREKVRHALLRTIETQELRESTKAVSIAKVRTNGGGDQNAITECLRAWRAGQLSMAEPWDAPAVSAADAVAEEDEREAARTQLAGMIERAATDGDRESVGLEIMRQLALGLIGEKDGKALQALLGEVRQTAQKKRENEPPPEDPTRLLLASELGMKAARAVDLMVSDARRDRVLAFIAAELDADAIECPNVDRGGAAG